LKETRPDQYEFFANLGRFDPITGAANPNYNPNPTNPLLGAAGLGGGSGPEGFSGSGQVSVGNGFGNGSSGSAGGIFGTGYTDVGDMFDGGGPGKSADTFGGALGGVSNAIGLTPSDFGYGDDD
jgi:hypothetical protein